MDNMVEELQDIYDQLQSFVEKANKNKAVKSLEKLELIASEVGKSWSGSWIGYQSRVYYKDFVTPPAGAHFSSEWGGMRDTSGAWTEYQFDFVQEHIRSKAGNPETKLASDATKLGRELFREKQNALLSILETYLLRRKDTFIESLVEKVKPMKIPSNSEWIETIRPTSIWSRDRLAVTQGITTPPHAAVIADVFDIRSPIYMCEELAKHAKTAASHIERQDREVRRMERV